MSIETKCICDRCKKDMIESRLVHIILGVGIKKTKRTNPFLMYYNTKGEADASADYYTDDDVTMEFDLCEQCMEELVNWIGLPPVKNTEAYQ